MVEEKKIVKNKMQNIILESRQKMTVSGVLDVENFNDECITMDTELGILIIKGYDLHINKLSLDNGELVIEGDIYSCEYDDREGAKSKGFGFFARMFK